MTWGIVLGAVASALWLAAADELTPLVLSAQPARPAFELLSHVPTAAGPVAVEPPASESTEPAASGSR